MMRKRSKLLLAVLLAALALPLFALPAARASVAGGSITGTVTDQRGAVVVGATATAYPKSGDRPAGSAKTDAQGRYRIEGLPAGAYDVVVEAAGFGPARVEGLTVEEGKATRADARLEVAGLKTDVEVKAAGMKPNSDPVYRALRDARDFSGAAYTLNNLELKRDGAVFSMSGELYFLQPVEGRTVAAVFIGGGEMRVEPPIECERKSISIFTGEPKLTEAFSTLVLRFSDKTFDEIKSSPRAAPLPSAPQAARAKDLYEDALSLVRKQKNPFGMDLRYNYDMRTLLDVYTPERPGFFTAFVGGARFKKLVYRVDPLGVDFLAPEEVALLSYGQSDWGFWAAFHREQEYAKHTASSDEDHRVYDAVRHEIDAAIKGTQLAVTDRLTLKVLQPGARVLPFDLYRSLRVSRVQDDAGRDLDFIQEDKDEDADFAVILPQQAKRGEELHLTVQYQGGEAIRDSGGGNYILIPRSTWYPNNPQMTFGDRARFDMTFRYPRGNVMVATGSPAEPEARDGDLMVSKWTSGDTDLTVAGFNYGDFKVKSLKDDQTGYEIAFYANREVPDEIKRVQIAIEQMESQGMRTDTTLGSISTTKVGDAAIADAENSTRLYNAFFGKLPYTRISMTQQPAAGFGQAWPTLVFMPYMAFIDSTQRAQLFGVRGGTDNFWRYVGPHEVAHQWWGHIVGWKSYRDQWMSEGFAEFSTSLYALYIRRDVEKFTDFWEQMRQEIIQPSQATQGRKPYTVGPVTQGYRLDSGKTGNVTRFAIYPKGAYILHMIRMMMYDNQTQDKRFQEMMQDFVKTYYNKDVSTEDFKAMVEKHMTEDMNLDGNRRMDWFFNEFVYGTEIPSYKFEYQISGDTLSGRVTQSGVSDDFKMVVPVYLDFGKGWYRLGQASIKGNSTVELGNIKLPQAPKRAAVCALKDVLALNVDNGKK
jgi:Carboxypeptidase regulatory-like domain/Peptidase family M1 domain